MKIVDTFITFGVQYQENPPEGEMAHPQGMFGTGYATIQAPSRNSAREIAYVLFGQKFAFDYDAPPRVDYVPDGEVLRVAILQRDQLLDAREIIAAAHDAADGDSSDEEIELLQQARDMLAEIIGMESK